VRAPLARALGMFLTLLLAAVVACTSEPEHGPGEVTWDRDACELCRMVISDRRFAVQVRDAHRQRLHRFDDLGCALLWLDGQLEGREDAEGGFTELWVRDVRGEQWIDGTQVAFSTGYKTPMGYGIHTATEASTEGMSLHEVRERIQAMERERRSVRGK